MGFAILPHQTNVFHLYIEFVVNIFATHSFEPTVDARKSSVSKILIC